MKILIAKVGESKIEEIVTFLKKEDYTIDFATTSLKAVEWIGLYDYDCILIFNAVTKQTFSLLREISSMNKTDGVLIVSRISEDVVKALELGADDYLIEPLNLLELNARIKAVIRRKKFQTKTKVYFGNIVIDLHAKTVFVWDNEMNLTRKEYEILLYLISNKEKVVPKITLAEYLWGESVDNLNTFDSLFAHIKNLRKKLKTSKAEVDFKSIYGVGYQIIEL